MMEKGINVVSVGNLVAVAVGVTATILIGVWGMVASSENDLRTEIERVEDALRTEIERVEDALRTEIGRVEDTLRTEIGKVDGKVDVLRTDVTGIAEDVGYLRGRMDERDLQRPADQ